MAALILSSTILVSHLELIKGRVCWVDSLVGGWGSVPSGITLVGGFLAVKLTRTQSWVRGPCLGFRLEW